MNLLTPKIKNVIINIGVKFPKIARTVIELLDGIKASHPKGMHIAIFIMNLSRVFQIGRKSWWSTWLFDRIEKNIIPKIAPTKPTGAIVVSNPLRSKHEFSWRLLELIPHLLIMASIQDEGLLNVSTLMTYNN